MISFRLTALILIVINFGTPSKCDLKILNSCTCPGQEITFECAVSDGGSTIWQGTALENCTNGRIVLRHSEFSNVDGYMIRGMCTISGTVTAQAISEFNNTYISQITITTSQELNGSTIECVDESISRSRDIILTTAFHSPTNVTLTEINVGRATFTWNDYSRNCASLYYRIQFNCGQCPNMTTLNYVTCIVTDINRECTISLQSVACGRIYGAINKFSIDLIQVPKVPNVMVLHTPDKHIFISTKLDQSICERSIIFATNCTITYIDFNKKYCGSATIPHCGCELATYNDLFNVSSSLCLNSNTINVTVTASNIIGDGPSSDPATVTLLPIHCQVTETRNVLNTSSSRECLGKELLTLTSSLAGFGVLVIATISTAFFITVKILSKKIKSNIHNEESDLKVYEEIQPIQREISTDKNVAYGHITLPLQQT